MEGQAAPTDAIGLLADEFGRLATYRQFQAPEEGPQAPSELDITAACAQRLGLQINDRCLRQ